MVVGALVIAVILVISYLVHRRRLRSPDYRTRTATAKRDRWADIEHRREEHQRRKAARTARFVGEDTPDGPAT